MKILLIGSSVLDFIHQNNLCLNKPGGVYYSALGLSSIRPKLLNLFLLTNYTDDYLKLVSNIYNNFNLQYSTLTKDIPIIHLLINPHKEREECYQNLSKPLIIPHNVNYTQFNGILINMITGFDISLSTLEDIRKNTKAIIYCDIHSLARGIDENNKRNFRKIPEAEKYLKCFDIVQVNETELLTISKFDKKEEIIEDVFNSGIKGLIITKSNKGVEGYYKTDLGIKNITLKANEVNTINTVGCGDIFGSIFFYSYICKQDFEYSLQLANYNAGIFSSLSEYSNFIINLEN